MTLIKQGIDIPFAKGLDTKTDPKRVPVGHFVQLENSVFDKGGLLQKRNGYRLLASLPSSNYSYLTTFNGNLTAVGSTVAAYNPNGMSWVSKGRIEPLSLKTLPVIRNNLNQTMCDVAVAPNGNACGVYLESDGTTTTAKYVIFDSATGQNIAAPAVIPVASGIVTDGLRVFLLGNNFVIVFTNVITAVSHLQFVAFNIYTAAQVKTNTDIASAYISAITLAWDGYSVEDRLFVAYNTTSGGQAIKVTYIPLTLTPVTAVTFSPRIATMVSVTADTTVAGSPTIFVSIYDAVSQDVYALAVDKNLNTLQAPVLLDAGHPILNIASAAISGVLSVFLEFNLAYSFDAALKTNWIGKVTLTGATASAVTQVIRSAGLGSKAFIVNSVIYVLGAFQSSYQPSYFLVNGSSSTSAAPIIVARIAYQNGGGFLTKGLPGVTVTDSVAQLAYLFKDLIAAVNKNTAVPARTQVNGIYSQTGVNLVTFTFGTDALDTAEIGSNLHISGGLLWMYDGYLPVEHNFLLYPDTDIANPTDMALWSATGGSMASHPQGGTTPDPNPGAYYYVFTYEWTDNQGNAFRSAPSIPVAVSTSGTASTGSVVLNIPTLRMTMKTANPVKIVIYRWSLGQQNYYQVTSITSPLLNITTDDQVTFTDTFADATILGNNLLYTTGGVLEDTAPPATDIMALFDTRLWTVNSEDRNSLNFSKQVIEATPVEMSDLLTQFIPPTVATATGEITSISPMDDKLIISKGGNSFVYINGTGPDNTGANNQYSQPIFITSTVGCANQKSIVFIPQGMLFQSNKGIWLLNRGLSTSYIGAPVEDFVLGATVQSAVTVPETNQVRFTLDSGITLMYDYYYDQWGTFVQVPCVSSCIYQSLHTFINSSGAAFQESVGSYLDGSNPVLMRFQTGPLRIGQLQNYQRAYYFYLLGTYLSPHKLNVSLLFDYEPSPSQTVLISPTNFSPAMGDGDSQTPFGQQEVFGGPAALETWRVFLDKQRCMAFAIRLQEIFDPTMSTAAGAGLTLSGINMVAAFKKAFRPQPAAESIG